MELGQDLILRSCRYGMLKCNIEASMAWIEWNLRRDFPSFAADPALKKNLFAVYIKTCVSVKKRTVTEKDRESA